MAREEGAPEVEETVEGETEEAEAVEPESAEGVEAATDNDAGEAEEQDTEEEAGEPEPSALGSENAEAVETEQAQSHDPRAELKAFMEAFGEALGARWYAEGKTFGEAQAAHAEALQKENAELKARIKAADLGDAEGVSFSLDAEEPQGPEGEKAARIAELTAKGYSENQAKLIAGTKLPTGK